MAVSYNSIQDLWKIYSHPIATPELYAHLLSKYTDELGNPTVEWLRRINETQYRITYSKYALQQSHRVGYGYYYVQKQIARYLLSRLVPLGLVSSSRVLCVGAGLGALVYILRHANKFSDGLYPDYYNVWGIEASSAIQGYYTDMRLDKESIDSIDTVNNRFVCNSHELSDGDSIYFSSTTTLPTPLMNDTVYYVRNAVVNDYFQISLTPTGNIIDLENEGAGEIFYYEETTTPIVWGTFTNKQPIRNALTNLTGDYRFHAIITEGVIEGLSLIEASNFFDDCEAVLIGSSLRNIIHLVNPYGVDNAGVGYRYQSLVNWNIERNHTFVHIVADKLSESTYVLGAN